MRYVPVEERFWPRVNKTATCWLWTGPIFDGYGRIKIKSQVNYVHRLSYEWAHGPVPDGMQVDHKCRVRHCVRPNHLQVVPQTLNAQNKGTRSDSVTGVRGVSWRPQQQSYIVRVSDPNGGRICGGSFKNLAEAESAAIALRNQLMTNNLQDRRSA